MAKPAPGAAPVVATGGVLPQGQALLDAIRPQMRRNRRGPGYSGSSAYLAKFFKVEEAALKAAVAELGLVPAPTAGAKGEPKMIGGYVYWVNQDGNGVLWINGREATPRDRADASKPSAAGAAPVAESSAPAAATDASGFQGSADMVDQARVTSALPFEAGEPSTAGEPPIFRAVPRAMPPVPVAAPESAEAEAEVVEEAKAPAAPEAAPSEPVAKAPARGAGKGGKAASAKKPRAKAASADAGEGDAEAAPAKPAPAPKAAARPRTKRRASAAIEQDAAAEE